ncbi:MAG: transposase [Spirochaetales bacterium]|nr:transposase [Spirochaetales bacterium]
MSRRVFTREFKIAEVKLIVEDGMDVKEVSKQLVVHANSLEGQGCLSVVHRLAVQHNRFGAVQVCKCGVGLVVLRVPFDLPQQEGLGI